MRVRGFYNVGSAALLFLIGTASLAGQTAMAQFAAQAPGSVVLPSRLQGVSRQLVAIHTRTQIRTSGRADAAMIAALDASDGQLRAALQQLDAVTASSGATKVQAEAAMESARARYQSESQALFTKLQLATTERDRYAQDLASVLVAASPSELDAQRRFGDGDFSVFDPMEAAILARQGAEQVNLRRQQSVQLRQLANNYAAMVAQGTPGRTASELLVRWDRAAGADPTHFWTHIERSRVAQTIGNLSRAQAAAQEGVGAAQGNWQRAIAQTELGDIALLRGDLGAAGRAHRSALLMFRILVISNPNSTALFRSVAVSLGSIGDIAVARGDLAGASAAYNESQVIRRRLLASNTSSVEAQRDLSMGLGKVGEVSFKRGDLTGAANAYSESVSIDRRLLAINPNSNLAQRDLSVSLDQLGTVAVARGDLAGAGTVYDESLVIRRRLSAGDPSSATAQRDVMVSLNRVGDTALARGDTARATGTYNESSVIARRLLALDATSAQAQSDVSFSLSKIGSAALAGGELTSASSAFNESLTIYRRLSALNSGSAKEQRNVSISLERIGDIAIKRGDLAGAGRAFDESLVIRRRLSALDPSSAQAQRDVSVLLEQIGTLAVARADTAGASRAYNEGLAIDRQILALDPTSAEARRDLGVSLFQVARLEGSTIRWSEVVTHWRAMKRDGLTASSDDRILAAIETMAAQEAGSSAPTTPRVGQP